MTSFYNETLLSHSYQIKVQKHTAIYDLWDLERLSRFACIKGR